MLHIGRGVGTYWSCSRLLGGRSVLPGDFEDVFRRVHNTHSIRTCQIAFCICLLPLCFFKCHLLPRLRFCGQQIGDANSDMFFVAPKKIICEEQDLLRASHHLPPVRSATWRSESLGPRMSAVKTLYQQRLCSIMCVCLCLM